MSRIAARAAVGIALSIATAQSGFAATDSGWAEVARARDGGCALSVTGNGRYFRIAASGLEPGASGRFVLTNGDMPPLDWRVRADGSGDFARYYLPFRWHREGDTVAVAIDGGGCALSASFDWRRARVAVR